MIFMNHNSTTFSGTFLTNGKYGKGLACYFKFVSFVRNVPENETYIIC